MIAHLCWCDETNPKHRDACPTRDYWLDVENSEMDES